MTALDERTCTPTITSGRNGDEPYSSWVRRAGCAGQSAVFGDGGRVREVVAVCGRCPVLRQCRAWALRNAVDGVAGGMRSDERAAWRKDNGVAEPMLAAEDFIPAEVVSLDRTWGRGRSDAILNAVARWSEDGETARQIGLRLGVTRRTVNRLRARCREREAS
jgi:WhiB family redox-sensing transcriptional regulator